MSTVADDLRSYVFGLLGPVCAPLHTHWETATGRAVGHLREFEVTLGDWQQTHLTRAHMHKLITTDPLPGLRLVEPCQNGRMMLAADDGTTLRLLHGTQGVVPPPGSNRARIRYYQQGQLAIPFGLVSALLGVWWADSDGTVTIRIVRTVDGWKFGSKAKVDLDFVLPRTSAEFEVLEFRPDDTGLEFEVPTREVAAEDLIDSPLPG